MLFAQLLCQQISNLLCKDFPVPFPYHPWYIYPTFTIKINQIRRFFFPFFHGWYGIDVSVFCCRWISKGRLLILALNLCVFVDVAEVAIKTSTRDQEKSPRGSCPNEHRWLFRSFRATPVAAAFGILTYDSLVKSPEKIYILEQTCKNMQNQIAERKQCCERIQGIQLCIALICIYIYDMICVFSYFYIYMICAYFLIFVISNLDFKVFVCFTCFPHDVLAILFDLFWYICSWTVPTKRPFVHIFRHSFFVMDDVVWDPLNLKLEEKSFL